MITEGLRPKMPPLPDRMKYLPIDPDRGYVVPWFVEWIDGKPDFRIMDGRKREQAAIEKLCWVCGKQLGARFAFVIGPMCSINLVSSEPPSHRECAEFSAKACPFLTMPKMVRRENDLPEERTEVPGMIARNPGVILVWITRSYKIVPVENNFIFRIGPPTETIWYAEGRLATRAEVEASIESGCPTLEEMARKNGPRAVETLHEARKAAIAYLPAV